MKTEGGQEWYQTIHFYKPLVPTGWDSISKHYSVALIHLQRPRCSVTASARLSCIQLDSIFNVQDFASDSIKIYLYFSTGSCLYTVQYITFSDKVRLANAHANSQ
jgi:hypothetical protein